MWPYRTLTIIFSFCFSGSRFSPSKEDLLLSLPKDEFTEDMYEELLELGETGVSRR